MSRKLVMGVLMVIGCLWFSAASMAQTSNTGRIIGTISDETGAILTGVEVVLRNTETGAARSVSSNERGLYVAADLNPGPYEITAVLTGFNALVRSGLTLTIGDTINLNLTMQVGSVSTQVTVTGEAPLVNTTTAGVSDTVTEDRITSLPLNGRDFGQLATVGTAAVSVRTASAGSAAKGYGTRLALSGSRPQDTGWTLDGSSVNSSGNFGTPGSSAGGILGVDAIREFRVITGGGYSAEFGGYSGGTVQMITKNGTNQLHGTAFGLHRNDNTDAREFFEPEKAEFRRNQFGGSAGGPIKQDKIFFFTAYEALRQARTGGNQKDHVPDLDTRTGLVTNSDGTQTQIAIAPSVKPIIDLWPAPNGENIGDGLAVRNSPSDKVTDEDYLIVRGDVQLTDNQKLFARFQFDNAALDNPRQLGVYNTVVSSFQRFTTMTWENIMGPTLLSTTSMSFNRTTLSPKINLNIDYPTSLYVPWHTFPSQFSFGGAGTFGVTDRPTFRTQNKWEWSQAFSWSHGAHAFKFGGSYSKPGFNTNGPAAGVFGSYNWSTAEEFLTDATTATFQVEAEGADTARTVRQNVFGFYIQDDWQFLPNLTLNLGMRYEPYLSPTEKWGRVSTYQDWTTQTHFSNPATDGTHTYFDAPGERMWSPRIGFAWDPKGDGKTAIRGGAGIYHVMILSPYLNTVVRKNPPDAGTLITKNAVNFADSVAYARSKTADIRSLKLSPSTFSEFIHHQMNPSYDIKFNLTVEREIANNLSLQVGYLGSRSSNLTQKSDCNSLPSIQIDGRPFVTRGGARPNPNNGVIQCSHTDAKSFYNAMTVELKRRMSQGFTTQVSYTWSRTVDDSTTGLGNSDFGEGVITQPYNHKADRGLAGTHLTHNFSVNGSWNIPSPNTGSFIDGMFGGWQLSSIATVTSGIPVRVELRDAGKKSSDRGAPSLGRNRNNQHPELMSGFNSGNMWTGTSAGCGGKFEGDTLGTPDRYYDPCAFGLPPAAPAGMVGGFYGNAGRNIIIGPAFSNVDFSVKKITPIGFSESATVLFHADFFNLLNHTNFGTPRDRVLRGNGAYESNAGVITRTSNTERQIQFGLKLVF